MAERRKIGELAAQDEYVLPNVNVESLYGALPKVSGEYNVPLDSNSSLGVSGSYYRPDMQAEPRWDAMLRYKRRF